MRLSSFLLGVTSVSAFIAPRPSHLAGSKNADRTHTIQRLSLDDGLSVIDAATAKMVTIGEGLSPFMGPLNTAIQAFDVIETLDGLNEFIDSNYHQELNTILSEFQEMFSETNLLESEFSTYLSNISREIDQWLLNQNPGVESLYNQVLSQITSLKLDTPEVLIVSSFITYTIVTSILTWDQPPPPSKPYPLQRYDPIGAQVYFNDKPVQAISRGIEISVKSLQFALSLLKDKIEDKWEANQEQRGMELAELLTELGPTFIKIGQSLSIRTDILSPAYIRGLASLQDKVPAFDTKKAKQILEEEWGRPVDAVLTKISDEPVAAASLGQVYKATMKDGTEVAIKVQRPNISDQIALDMHLLREFAPVAKRTFNLNTDTVGTVDAWGAGFVDELDYLQEAENGKYFTKKIQETPLKDVVIAPTVVDDLSTGSVLVTEWIDGQRLDQSSSEDITVLCSICMNTYLTMLLELGVLHCDPHPGNLLRTNDGKLCILDWGMVTRLPSELQLTLIEHMAHLTSSDYAEVPRDLLLLGFIPEDKADLINDSGIVEVLADIYGAWTSGGGVAAINVNQVINQLQDLTAKKGNLFQIPPYFAYIAKSFSVLEGIGLSNDAKYSIINQCLPYVSNRLLTDKDSMGPALSTFMFGPEKGNIETRIVDYRRVEQLVEGFGNFSTSASGALLGKEELSRTEVLEAAADQVLDIVITDEVSPFQDILLEQLAKIVAANSRSIWTEARERSGTLPSGRSVLGAIVDPLGLFQSSPIVNTCDRDQKTVEMTQKLVELMQRQASASSATGLVDFSDLQQDEILELSAILAQKVWSRRVSFLRTGSRFATKLLEQTAGRLESGERIRRPSRIQSDQEDTEEAPTDGATSKVSSPTNDQEVSQRLMDARSRLEQLNEAEDNATVLA